jgi:hypothetical protein
MVDRVPENDTHPLKSYALTAVRFAFQIHPVRPELAKTPIPRFVRFEGRVKCVIEISFTNAKSPIEERVVVFIVNERNFVQFANAYVPRVFRGNAATDVRLEQPEKA